MKLTAAAAAILIALLAWPADAAHIAGHGVPLQPAPNNFAPDFVPPKDSEWNWDIGGFGGEERGKALRFNPVIFVHGNTADASFWRTGTDTSLRVDVPNKLIAHGYANQELWGLSYNGASCGSGNTAGCGTANDVNIEDLYAFIQAVRAYTGSAKVDIVSHSLGVTVVRRAMQLHPDLLSQIEDFVGAAGANHGTSVCRGFEDSFYGCNEVAPGSAWLTALNGSDETPGEIRYMTIYDGTGTGDIFFQKHPAGCTSACLYDDSKSPALAGADNREMPNAEHTSLGRGEQAVAIYLPFVSGTNEVRQTDGNEIAGEETPLARTGPFPLRLMAFCLLILGLLIRNGLTRWFERPERSARTP